jgi:hypothetical protein
MPVTLPNVVAHTIASAADFNAVSDRAEWAGNTVEDMMGALVDYTSQSPWTATTTNPSIGSGQIGFRYGFRPGKILRVEFGIIMASNTNIGSGSYRFKFPNGVTQRTDANSALVSGHRGQAYVIHTNPDTSRTKHTCNCQVFASTYFEVGFGDPIQTLGSSTAPFPAGSWNVDSWIGGWLETEIA